MTNKDYCEIRFGGTGGQGLILAAIILAEAAMREGLNVVQTQVYGPESRGGASRADLIISRSEISYPEVTRPDIFLALSQKACDRYVSDLTDEGLLLIDSYFVRKVPLTAARILPMKFAETAKDELGKEIVANIVALGALAEASGLVDFDILTEAVALRVPSAFRELNTKALAAGRRLAQGSK